MSTQWVNTQPDAGALHALLVSLMPRIPLIDIDELWIFPTRKIAVGESTVIVLSLFDADEARRRVMTARFTVSRDKKGVAKVIDKVDEYGTAPLEAVSRVVDGVVRRLGEDIEQPPRNEAIGGTRDAWNTLLTELGAPRTSLLEDPADAADGDDSAPTEPVYPPDETAAPTEPSATP